MAPFTQHEGVAAVIPVDDIDTDQIIPARFMKTVERTGLGRGLFHSWRHHADGAINGAFVLNRAPFEPASFLVTGANFGCGSSREHAPWALQDFGVRCIVARSFADIFEMNCFACGLLTIKLDLEEMESLTRSLASSPRLRVDLPAQRLSAAGIDLDFAIEPARKFRLLNGLDAIDLTLTAEPALAAFERRLVALGE